MKKGINWNMKKEEVVDWATAIDYLIIHALTNMTKHITATIDDIFKEDYAYDSIVMNINKCWSYSDEFYENVRDNPTTYIKRTEYCIAAYTPELEI